MADLNLNNQYTYNPLMYNGANPSFAQYDAAYNPNMQGAPAMGVGYDEFRNQVEAKSKDNALAQATKDYDAINSKELVKNLLLGLGMSAAFTAGTNWVMSSKQVAEGASNIQDFQKTRLYVAGDYLDKKVGGSAVGRFISKTKQGIKNIAAKIPVPDFLKEIRHRMKVGGIAVLDKQGMYSLGKGAEALNEAIEYLSRVPEAQIKNLPLGDKQDEVLKVLKQFREGKLRGPVAYQKIGSYFDNIPAKELSKLSVGSPYKVTQIVDKVLTTSPNINHALNKARFFNGLYNKTQGPIAKALQKITALVGEASGGGVLGGKMALIMNTIGLLTGFNAASNAEKGDKLKAFMEDYIGFTLGSYVMSFFVGTWFNKFLGVSELGMDKEAVKAVGKRLGIDMSQGRLQDAVIAYNREFKQTRNLTKIAEDYRNGKITFKKALSQAQKINAEGFKEITNSHEFLNQVERTIGGKDKAYYDALKKDIKAAMKSKLTLGSVLKETEHNKGGFLSRLGRYVVQKPLSIIGRTLSIGRYDLVSGNKHSMKSYLKFAKRFGGGFGRALLVMFVLVEPFRKGFMKLSHLIFGKPKNSALDEGKTDDKKENKQIQDVINNQQQQNNDVNQNNVNVKSDTNILENILKNPPPKTVNAESIINDTMPGEPLNQDNVPELVRTYVPSPMPSEAALRRDPKEDAVERALRHADAAERAAMSFLH